MQDLINTLEFAEKGTKILGFENYPSAHLHDVVIANIVSKCTKKVETAQPNCPTHMFANELKKSMLKYRKKRRMFYG